MTRRHKLIAGGRGTRVGHAVAKVFILTAQLLRFWQVGVVIEIVVLFLNGGAFVLHWFQSEDKVEQGKRNCDDSAVKNLRIECCSIIGRNQVNVR